MKRFYQSFFVTMFALLTSTNLFAFDCEVDGIYYNRLSTDELEVTYGTNKYTGDVVIPRTVTYRNAVLNVTQIGESAFAYCTNLTQLELPDEVTVINGRAFNGCEKLTHLNLPNKLSSIGDYAFMNCAALTEVSIPKSVNKIGRNAYMGCTGLQKVIINDIPAWCSINFASAESNPLYYAKHFYRDENTECKMLFFDDNIQNIGNYAFYNAEDLLAIYIDNMTPPTIGANTFSNTCYKWTFICVGKGMKETLLQTDHWKNFMSITETGYYPIVNGIRYFIKSKKDVRVVALENREKYSGDIVIPESITDLGYDLRITSIENDAFWGCTGLTSITIPNSVTNIGDNAFSVCSGLTSVTIPNSVTSIGRSAFSGCSGLTSVTIPNSVTSIGRSVFSGCSGLTSITIPNSVTSIGEHAFRGCSSLTSITIPNGVTSIGNYAFYDCSKLTSITIPNGVTSIGEDAFYDCSKLTSITIPNSVTSIGGGAFSYCSGLASIKVEAGNTNYDSRDNCNAIIETASNTLVSGCKNTVIPNSVTSIGNNAFFHCSRLTSVTIPNSVTSIGNGAFYECFSLTYIVIPNSVTSIGNRAFCSCYYLTSVTVLNPTPIAINQDTFSLTDALLYVPIGSKKAYEAADYWKDFKEIIEIDVTGIDQLMSNEKNNAKIFTLDGKRIDKPQKGINIIGGKKVVVK